MSPKKTDERPELRELVHALYRGMQRLSSRGRLLDRFTVRSTETNENRSYVALPTRQIATVEISVDGSGEKRATFQPSHDVVLDYIVAQVTDSAGLLACRLGWQTDAGQRTDFMAPDPDVGSIILPVAQHIAVDNVAALGEVEPVYSVFEKAQKRVFIAENLVGVPTYTVRLGLHLRFVRRAD